MAILIMLAGITTQIVLANRPKSEEEYYRELFEVRARQTKVGREEDSFEFPTHLAFDSYNSAGGNDDDYDPWRGTIHEFTSTGCCPI